MVVALGVCGGALFWAYRTTLEGMKPMTKWARLLRSGDLEDRRTAARQLGSCEKEEIDEAVPALVAGMNDGVEEVRADVASALGTLSVTALRIDGHQARVKEVMNALVGALGDAGAEVRTAAAMSIGICASQPWDKEQPLDPASTITKLARLIEDESASVRSSAESAVGRLAAKAPVTPPASLVEGATAWPSKEARRSAVVALGMFKKDVGPTVAALTKALEDKEPEVRSDAAAALRTIGLEAAPALPTLVKTLNDPFVPPPPPPTRLVAVTPPGGGAGGTPETTDPTAQAARAIGRIASAQFQQSKTAPPAELVEALTRAIGSDHQTLHESALDALRRIGKGASAAVPTLAKLLAGSTSKPEPGQTLASLLADVAPGTDHASDAIAALTAALDSTDGNTQLAAVTAVGRFGPAAAAALPKLQALGAAKGNSVGASAAIKLATDRVEGKAPPEAPRRKGQRRGGR